MVPTGLQSARPLELPPPSANSRQGRAALPASFAAPPSSCSALLGQRQQPARSAACLQALPRLRPTIRLWGLGHHQSSDLCTGAQEGRSACQSMRVV